MSQKDSIPRPLPSWIGKPNNELTLKEALAKIKQLEREAANVDKLVAKANRLLEDALP